MSVVHLSKGTGHLSKLLFHLPGNILLSSGLILFTILSRLPFTTQVLYHWDSVNFALALTEFNLAKEQPHPPGYILYVYLGRLVQLLVPDPTTALNLISLAASALSVAALFFLGQEIFDRKVGLISAFFLATSPLFWFYGEIPLPHTIDAFLIILSAWCLYRVKSGDQRYIFSAAAIMAILGGFRQQSLVMMIPLVIFAVYRVRVSHLILAALVGGVICLAWFIPLIYSQGGLESYLKIMEVFSDRFMSTTSIIHGGGWRGVFRNFLKLSLYTLYGWSLALIPALFYISIRLRRAPFAWNWGKSLFMLLWIAPFMTFYLLIHMGQQGLVFVFLPALVLISAVGLTRLLNSQPPWVLLSATSILLLFNIGVFCLLPEYPLGPDTQRLLTRTTLANSDRYYQDRFNLIKENFAPESTIILAANWHHVEYYLPEYSLLLFNIGNKWEVDEGVANNSPSSILTASPAELGLQLSPTGSAAVIIFDPELINFNDTPELIRQLALPAGGSLAYLELEAEDRLYLEADIFGLRQK